MAIKTYDQRLDALLSTAARVFAARGFHHTTMRELSRETRMSLAGIYHYVDGKETLLYLIQKQCFEAVSHGARQAVESAGEVAEDRVRAFMRHHLTFFAAHMSEMKVLSHEADSLSGPRAEEIIALKRRYVDLLAGLVDALDSGPDPRLGAFGVFGMMNWIYTWYRPDGSIPVERLAEHFTNIALHGLLGSPMSATRAD